MKLSKLMALGCVGAGLAMGSMTVSYADDDTSSHHSDGCCNLNINQQIEQSDKNHLGSKNGCCSLRKAGAPKNRSQVKSVEKKESDDIDVDPDIDI